VRYGSKNSKLKAQNSKLQLKTQNLKLMKFQQKKKLNNKKIKFIQF